MDGQVVTFHVRAIRYGAPIRSEEYDTIDDAVRSAFIDFDAGHSAGQEVWSGDECILDHDATVDRFEV